MIIVEEKCWLPLDSASAAVGPSLHGEGGFNLLVRDFAAACTTSQTFFTQRDNQIIQQGVSWCRIQRYLWKIKE